MLLIKIKVELVLYVRRYGISSKFAPSGEFLLWTQNKGRTGNRDTFGSLEQPGISSKIKVELVLYVRGMVLVKKNKKVELVSYVRRYGISSK